MLGVTMLGVTMLGVIALGIVRPDKLLLTIET
jgi:hypothetical protein